MPRRSRVLLIVIAALVVLAAASWAAAGVLADRLIGSVTAQLAAGGGPRLALEGQLGLSFTPAPHLRGGPLRILAIDGGETLAEAQSVDIALQPGAALLGRARAAHVRLAALRAPFIPAGQALDVDAAFDGAAIAGAGAGNSLRIVARRTDAAIEFEQIALDAFGMSASGAGGFALDETRRLTLNLNRVSFNGRVLGDLALAAGYAPDGVIVERISLHDAAGVDWGAFGNLTRTGRGMTFAGGFELVSSRDATEIDGAGRIDGEFSPGAWKLELSDVSLRGDDAQLGGKIALDGGARLRAVADLRLDRLDLARPPRFLAIAALLAGAETMELRARVATLAWGDRAAEGVILDLTGGGGAFELRELAVRDFGGASLIGRGRLRLDADNTIVFDPLEFRRAGLSGAGQVTVSLAPGKPSLRATLAAGPIAVESLLTTDPNATRSPPTRSQIAAQRAAAASPGWSREPIALPVVAAPPVDAVVTVTTPRLSWGARRLDDAKVTLRRTTDRIEIEEFSGQFYGGRLEAHGAVGPADAPQLNLSARLTGAALEAALLDQLGMRNFAAGKFDASADLASRGASAAELIAGLSGEVRLSARDATLNGVDLRAAAERLARNSRPADMLEIGRTLLGGRTQFARIEGGARIERGVARLGGVALTSPSGEIRAEGAVNLPGWSLDVANEIRFAGAGNPPPFTIRLRGPLGAPNAVFDIAALQAYLSKRNAPAR